MVNDKSSDDASFAELMTGVKKIADDRVNIYRDQGKKSAPSERKIRATESNLDYANINHQQLSSIRESQFDPGIQKKLERKIRQGQLPVEDQIDLHGYNQNEAIAELGKFLLRAVAAEFKLLVIIHGKGNRSGKEAVLRPLVRHWLANQTQVLGWCPAQPRHGGAGASYVYLRAPR